MCVFVFIRLRCCNTYITLAYYVFGAIFNTIVPQLMSRKQVKVHVTFVTASPGSKPSPVIENSVDVFNYTGYVKDYDGLMVAVRDMVETK